MAHTEHHPLDTMETTGKPFLRHRVSDPSGTIGAVAGLKTAPDPLQQFLVMAFMSARRND